MKKLLFTTLLIGCFGCMQSKAQRVIEFGIKPTELAFLNIEANFAFGTPKTRYGVILGYRPSTKDSGLIKSGGTGAAGGYGQPGKFADSDHPFSLECDHSFSLEVDHPFSLQTDHP